MNLNINKKIQDTKLKFQKCENWENRTGNYNKNMQSISLIKHEILISLQRNTKSLKFSLFKNKKKSEAVLDMYC